MRSVTEKVGIVAIIALAVGPLAFLGGMKAENWRLTATHAKALQDLADGANDAVSAAQARQQAVELELATERRNFTAKLGELNDANIKLQGDLESERDCVRTGKCRVFVAASCAVPADRVPGAGGSGSTAAGGTVAGTARLGSEAAENYLDYKRLYQEQLSTLRKCHLYAQEIMKRKKAPQ